MLTQEELSSKRNTHLEKVVNFLFDAYESSPYQLRECKKDIFLSKDFYSEDEYNTSFIIKESIFLILSKR